jgi:hypothetical protein
LVEQINLYLVLALQLDRHQPLHVRSAATTVAMPAARSAIPAVIPAYVPDRQRQYRPSRSTSRPVRVGSVRTRPSRRTGYPPILSPLVARVMMLMTMRGEAPQRVQRPSFLLRRSLAVQRRNVRCTYGVADKLPRYQAKKRERSDGLQNRSGRLK